MSFQIIATEAWKTAYPGAVVGVLAMHGVRNPANHPSTDARKRQVEEDLRKRFSGCTRDDLKKNDRIKAYDEYYGGFGKTYHVLLQLESVALKGKPLASVGALVEVMFIAEVGNLLLTAGHDLDTMASPITIDIARGTESYELFRGTPQTPKEKDMMMTDAHGIISCMLHGPDKRTRIHEGTKNVLFVVYAPKGIGGAAARSHLEEIRDGTLAIAPAASVELLELFEA